MGGLSKANGEAFESALDVYHGHLATTGRAWIRRVGTPVTVLGSPSKGARGRWYFRACFSGHQGVDFVGHTDAGRAVVLEAKSHAGADAWQSGIGPGGDPMVSGALGRPQWVELVTAEKAGAVSLIIVSAWGSVWSMTPSDLTGHTARVRRSTVRRSTVRRDEIEHFARRLHGVEWLPWSA